jgi:hypothetical protein
MTPLIIHLVVMSTNPTGRVDLAVIRPERRTCPGYDSDDADIELISSDNVMFKVHSYTLQHASYVFLSLY